MSGALGMVVAGLAAGSANGLFGAGGGMLLVPALTRLTDLPEEEIFPSSLAIILPVSLISLTLSNAAGSISPGETLPYLIGAGIGGGIAGWLGKKIPVLWLHRVLGLLILWGGVRCLWPIPSL